MLTRTLRILAICLLVLVAAGSLAFAKGPLSGSVDTAMAFNLLPFAVQTDSDTYTKLAVVYKTDGWSFGSLTTFDMSGIATEELSALGALGLILVDSRLVFSPVLGSGSAVLTYTRSVNEVAHEYDLGRSYYVSWVSVTGVVMNSSGTQWRIEVSTDRSTWVQVGSDYAGNVDSGQVSVNRIAQYVRVYAFSGGFVDESTITVSVAGTAWTTKARLVLGGLTLDSVFTIATGDSSYSLTVSGTERGLAVSASVFFDLSDPAQCRFCFDRSEGEVTFSLACVDEATLAWKLDHDGFEEVSLAAKDLDLGLSFLTFDVKVSFSLTSKTLSLVPEVELAAGPCMTIYAAVESDHMWEFGGLSIYGIGVTYSWNGVSFESLSYLDDLHHVKDTYWERFTIKSVGDTCCGGRFEFSVSTYFDKTSVSLFDWAETEVSTSFGVTAALAIRLKAVARVDGPEELVFGFLYTW